MNLPPGSETRRFLLGEYKDQDRVYHPGGCTMNKALIVGLLVIALVVLAAVALFGANPADPRNQSFLQWRSGDSSARSSLIIAQREACPGAPFVLPSDGFIGLLYGDPRGPYSVANPHQGIDIFSDGAPGEVPVYAAYDGYVSREPGWQSTVIMRVPDDPLQPGRQIWLYYTHMADREGNNFIIDAIPPGTSELFVEQGTLLGYTGDYNGTSARDIWVHLHFSIVQDDGNGRYLNELEYTNTLDPSPYLGRDVNYVCADGSSGCGTAACILE